MSLLRELELLRKQVEEIAKVSEENRRVLKEIPLKQLAETNDQCNGIWYGKQLLTNGPKYPMKA
jgi:hypothetical protein